MIRRAIAGALDAAAALALIGVGFLVGFFDRTLFNPAPGWFYTEWWLKYWLDQPTLFTAPALWWLIVWVAWVAGWELATGRTPGARLMGFEFADADGDEPGVGRLSLRAAGLVLNALTLGLTWAWGFVSPTRRPLTDYLSGTWAVSTRD